MFEEYIANRIYELRIKNNISARELSLAIGQNKNYINIIENGKALPSMMGFNYICEYFNISPQEFFDEENLFPVELNEIIVELKKLNEKSLDRAKDYVKLLNNQK